MALPGLLSDYGDEIEADLQRVYSLDLLDVYRGTLSPRKLMVYIEQLPPGSATWNATGGDSAWNVQEHLTANLLDAQNIGNWIAAGGKPSDKPKPVPRPADLVKKRRANEAILARAERFKNKAAMHVIVPGEPAEDEN